MNLPVNIPKPGGKERRPLKKRNKSWIEVSFARIFSRGCYSLYFLFLISSNSKDGVLLWITWKRFFRSTRYKISKYVVQGGMNGHAFGYKFSAWQFGVDKYAVALFFHTKLCTGHGCAAPCFSCRTLTQVTALQKSEQSGDVTQLPGKPSVTWSAEFDT